MTIARKIQDNVEKKNGCDLEEQRFEIFSSIGPHVNENDKQIVNISVFKISKIQNSFI